MVTIRKPYPKTAPDLQPHLQSHSRTALDKKSEGGPQAFCDPPEISRRVDPLWEDRATGVAQQGMDSDALENKWAAHQEMGSETLQEVWEAHEKIASTLAPTASIPSGVTMLTTPVGYRRRGKRRSAHYEDIKAGLFIEPVLIGLRAKATPDYEVDTLIAANIAGKSYDEIRALVIKLRAARKRTL